MKYASFPRRSSTASSRDISESIKVIVSKIEGAMAANAETSRVFAALDAKIRDGAKLIAGTFAGISEIQIGSKQILQAMVELRERSVRVKEGSAAMNEGSLDIKRMMDDLSRISAEVTSHISEITIGIADIGTSIRAVAEFAEEVSAGSAQLDEEVNRFKTAREEPATLEGAENFSSSPDFFLREECLQAG